MGTSSFLRKLLNRRDWVYLLSLLIPFIVYDLSLKASDITLQPASREFTQILELTWSDVFFDLGYALLWIGAFAAVARRGLVRRAVVVLFHVVTMLVVVVTTCAHQYFRETGTTLDYGTITEWIPKLNEIEPILLQDIPPTAWILLFSALLYAVLGPWLLTQAVERGWGWMGGSSVEVMPSTSVFGLLALFLLSLGFGSLSSLVGISMTGVDMSFAREPFVNVVLTGVEEAADKEGDNPDAAAAIKHPT